MEMQAWLRLNRLGLRRSRLITVPVTKAPQWDALAPGPTTGLIPASQPSPTPSDKPTGPAVPSLSSVIGALSSAVATLLEDSGRSAESYLGDVWEWLDAIAAPDAETPPSAPSSVSTSAKPDSESSAPHWGTAPCGSLRRPDEQCTCWHPGCEVCKAHCTAELHLTVGS